MERLNILHVEDSKEDCELFRFTLDNSRMSYSYKCVDNEFDFINELNTNKYDIIVADYYLPSYSGLEALEYVKSKNLAIPFIFVSGTLGEQNAVEMLKRGANDYLIKGNISRLSAAIERAIKESRYIKEKILAEERLRDSLKEKELLLKEVHHRVKNNLQIISSLVRLQASNIKNNEIQNILVETNNRIMAMSLLHQKLYQSKSLSKVDFHEYINSLINHLSYIFSANISNIDFNINVDNIDFDIDTSVPCGLLINEIVSNSIKHAFDEKGGNVYIELTKKDDENYRMVIADNGKGFGFDLSEYRGDTLGLQLISSLISQLDGNMELKNSNGTSYIINFSRMHYHYRG